MAIWLLGLAAVAVSTAGAVALEAPVVVLVLVAVGATLVVIAALVTWGPWAHDGHSLKRSDPMETGPLTAVSQESLTPDQRSAPTSEDALAVVPSPPGPSDRFSVTLEWIADRPSFCRLSARNLGPGTATNVVLSTWMGHEHSIPVPRDERHDRSRLPDLPPGLSAQITVDLTRTRPLPGSLYWRIEWTDTTGDRTDEGLLSTLPGRPLLHGASRPVRPNPVVFGIRYQNTFLQIDYKGVAIESPRPPQDIAVSPLFESFAADVAARFEAEGVHLSPMERTELVAFLRTV